MPSDMREAVAAAVDDARRAHLGKPTYASDEEIADAALAVIRERLAEKVPRQPEKPGIRCDYYVAWNDCLDAMLRELGGEG